MKKANIQSTQSLKIRKIVFFLLLLSITFTYGVGVGVYHWPPFTILKDIKIIFKKNINISNKPVYSGEKELLRVAFTDPLIEGEMIYKPINSLDELHRILHSIIFPYNNFYNDIYKQIMITEAVYLKINQGKEKVLKLSYKINEEKYYAYAYAPLNELDLHIAALIIPGSGENQSSQIYKNNSSNYHYGIIDALGKNIDSYVLIKPNEDILAFHNGKNKLNYDFIISYLLNYGGSYSAYYITNSIAIIKYLKKKYDKIILAGLSQSGRATLLAALQAEPDIAIISSGFSIINEKVEWAGYKQIIIPNLFKQFNNKKIKQKIKKSTTNFLFTYGIREVRTYRIEAEKKLTCNYFSNIKNVSCQTHSKGHCFPKTIIQEFLNRYLWDR
ncbi:hypothetical protein SAMN04488516_10784 [Desulfonauticus submarinus]|uniref:Alpha/beta hydrolase family protein n=1 Tax=Desulfonauticus submarinus TaxID=206665 RepID=A0A1H0EFC4_9BACT|nr:hypothetical protein [Desulfonauticus submarinus]SDN80976.1 hypothetical protein SAMN04488516_10784 [Desulfonauticus submarinus]